LRATWCFDLQRVVERLGPIWTLQWNTLQNKTSDTLVVGCWDNTLSFYDLSGKQVCPSTSQNDIDLVILWQTLIYMFVCHLVNVEQNPENHACVVLLFLSMSRGYGHQYLNLNFHLILTQQILVQLLILFRLIIRYHCSFYTV